MSRAIGRSEITSVCHDYLGYGFSLGVGDTALSIPGAAEVWAAISRIKQTGIGYVYSYVS